MKLYKSAKQGVMQTGLGRNGTNSKKGGLSGNG